MKTAQYFINCTLTTHLLITTSMVNTLHTAKLFYNYFFPSCYWQGSISYQIFWFMPH